MVSPHSLFSFPLGLYGFRYVDFSLASSGVFSTVRTLIPRKEEIQKRVENLAGQQREEELCKLFKERFSKIVIFFSLFHTDLLLRPSVTASLFEEEFPEKFPVLYQRVKKVVIGVIELADGSFPIALPIALFAKVQGCQTKLFPQHVKPIAEISSYIGWMAERLPKDMDLIYIEFLTQFSVVKQEYELGLLVRNISDLLPPDSDMVSSLSDLFGRYVAVYVECLQKTFINNPHKEVVEKSIQRIRDRALQVMHLSVQNGQSSQQLITSVQSLSAPVHAIFEGMEEHFRLGNSEEQLSLYILEMDALLIRAAEQIESAWRHRKGQFSVVERAPIEPTGILRNMRRKRLINLVSSLFGGFVIGYALFALSLLVESVVQGRMGRTPVLGNSLNSQ